MDQANLRKSKVSMAAIKSTTKSLANFNPKSISRMKVRRLSYGFGTGVAGIRAAERRSSQLGLEFKRPPLLYLNTYQLEPHVRFHVPQVIQAANDVLDAYFTDHIYNIQDSPSVSLRIAGEIMRNVKSLSFNRYRIITVVTLGQKRAQSYNNAVAFLWDHERDSIVNVQREHGRWILAGVKLAVAMRNGLFTLKNCYCVTKQPTSLWPRSAAASRIVLHLIHFLFKLLVSSLLYIYFV